MKYYSGTGYRKSLVCNIPTSAATSGDVTVSVRRELAPLVGELMRQTESKYGYDIRRGVTGGFNCRYIKSGGYERPDKGPSNHAYGRAVDINWDANPQSYTFRSDIPPAVVALWMRHGFYWGGMRETEPGAVEASLQALFAMRAEGRLQPHPGTVLPFERLDEAYALLRERRAIGKVILKL